MLGAIHDRIFFGGLLLGGVVFLLLLGELKIDFGGHSGLPGE